MFKIILNFLLLKLFVSFLSIFGEKMKKSVLNDVVNDAGLCMEQVLDCCCGSLGWAEWVGLVACHADS